MPVLGAISGTSMDGIDVALLDTDGEAPGRALAGRTYPYDAALRAALLDLAADPARAENGDLAAIEAAVTRAHVEAARALIAESGVAPARVTLAGLHGQTILHRPERGYTRQLLDGALATRLLGMPVVARFRHADMAAGGQGAPLAPLYHRALARDLPGPLMVLNLGGVANVTYLDGETVIAFDTGPASAPLDDFVRARRGLAYDANGALAAAGRPDIATVETLMALPFFAAPPPKSLDRNDFHAYARAVERLTDADGAATLAAFTVASIAAARRHVPRAPRRWLVAGGGRRNAFFMDRLRAELAVPVDPVETVGWDGDFLEAQLFAWLAARARRGLPLSLPSTTGCRVPTTGGEFFEAA
ncbi:MAG: anhydro-N-acetylmuramic acid kinase [Magnetospirillum sp.]|nr:anhydro-N-acetylmuramic acid kinase [Magnetospirillum sp.]